MLPEVRDFSTIRKPDFDVSPLKEVQGGHMSRNNTETARRFAEGKIQDIRILWDAMGFAGQLGIGR
jgi:hypothetical protein